MCSEANERMLPFGSSSDRDGAEGFETQLRPLVASTMAATTFREYIFHLSGRGIKAGGNSQC
jgi:hypothetical protein